ARGDGAAEEPEVTGHEGQDARREEGDETGERGDRDREPQRSVEDDRARVHSSSATASATRVFRMEALASWPMKRAATRPCLSSTSVVGAAWIGATDCSA